MKFNNEISENVWKDRYCKNNETLHENFVRVAEFCSKNDKEKEDFIEIMENGLFFPAGRTMSNSGIGNKLNLNNCFVAPQVRDNYEDIFDKVKLGALTHQRGGGIGYDFSMLRPKGSPTSNGAIASGAVSFMDVFNAQTETTIQGQRRGANMAVMNVYDMDIETFINAKAEDPNKLNHFNLSVMVDDEFIDAVKSDKEVYLHHPVYNDFGEIEKDQDKWIYSRKVSAKKIWDEIMQKAYDNGEPGIFFYDNINNDNNLKYIENIVCSNPCAEYLGGTVYGNNPVTGEPLDPAEYGGACNLGSLFLHNFVIDPFTDEAHLNFSLLRKTIFTAVRMLDNVIDVNTFPHKIYENYQKNFRTIGIGFTGLADALAMLGMKYNSEEARTYVDNLVEFIAFNSYKASIEIAKERGSFPFLDREKFVNSGYLNKHCKEIDSSWREIKDDILRYGIRNGKILSIAPVGTLSMTFGNNCSSGLEPIFSLEYNRKVKIGGQTEDKTKIVKMQDYAYKLWNEVKNNMDVTVTEDVFVTALDMTVDEHVDMLGVIAKHVDMSCSKTINVPEDYSFEDTKNIYMKCHDLGIKGCTIFRPNALRQGVLITSTETSKERDNHEVLHDVDELQRGYIVSVDDDLISYKRTLRSGCGKMYIHLDFDEVTGEPYETWINLGSGGGCERNLQFISRLISMALRGGIPITEIIDQARSIRPCKAYTDRTLKYGDTSKGTSCPSAIGNALEELENKIQDRCFADDEDESYELCDDCEIQCLVTKIADTADKCPECGEPVEHEGGCIVCRSCGWNKCD